MSNSIYIKTEADYRRDRIRQSAARNRHGRVRLPFVRRPAERTELG
jgi:hypothetical protein